MAGALPPAFPSVADAAFLLLPCSVVVASAGKVRPDRMSALRPVLDGVIIASALFLVCWVLILEELVVDMKADDRVGASCC